MSSPGGMQCACNELAWREDERAQSRRTRGEPHQQILALKRAHEQGTAATGGASVIDAATNGVVWRRRGHGGQVHEAQDGCLRIRRAHERAPLKVDEMDGAVDGADGGGARTAGRVAQRTAAHAGRPCARHSVHSEHLGHGCQ